MKVSEAIELLSEYDNDDEIVIGWWDKKTVEGYLDEEDNFQLTDEQWNNIVTVVGLSPAGFEDVGEWLAELATEYWQMIHA